MLPKRSWWLSQMHCHQTRLQMLGKLKWILMHVGKVRNDNRKLGNCEENWKSLANLERWQPRILQSVAWLSTSCCQREDSPTCSIASLKMGNSPPPPQPAESRGLPAEKLAEGRKPEVCQRSTQQLHLHHSQFHWLLVLFLRFILFYLKYSYRERCGEAVKGIFNPLVYSPSSPCSGSPMCVLGLRHLGHPLLFSQAH